MVNRREFLTGLTAACAGSSVPSLSQTGALRALGANDRNYWVEVLQRLAQPVLGNLAPRRLKTAMPVESYPGASERREYSHLEAMGRLLAGIAPWLELGAQPGKEGNLRQRYAELSRESLSAATDPKSPDYMNFAKGQQPLVDTAFLAHAIIRAPNELWTKLDTKTRRDLVAALKSTRVIRPSFNNWLLFSAMIESTLYVAGEQWDRAPIDYALRQHEQWYKGDGVYGDGPDFHWDYYNSFVIHPMLIDILRVVSKGSHDWDEFAEKVLVRARRYAAVEERLISPEATFPAIGRSLAYRFAAFHLLAQMALMRTLPEGVTPAQVRCGLTAVMRRMIEAPGTFDADGWLTIGFCGHQPAMGERYISTGSLYLCAVGLLPLGLPAQDDFWTAAPQEWTSVKIWSGRNLGPDHAI